MRAIAPTERGTMAKMGKHAKEACCVDSVKDVVSRVQRGLLAATLVLFLIPAGVWTASRAYAEGEELTEQEVLEASDIPASQSEDDDELKLEVSTDPDAGWPVDSDADDNAVDAVVEDDLVDDETAVPDPTDESGTAPTEEDTGIAPASDIVVDDTVEMQGYISGMGGLGFLDTAIDCSSDSDVAVPIWFDPKDYQNDEWETLPEIEKDAADCFSVISNDPNILTAAYSYNPQSNSDRKGELTLRGLSTGMASITVDYACGRFKGSVTLNAYVVDHPNLPVSIRSLAPSFEVHAFSVQRSDNTIWWNSYGTDYEPYPEFDDSFYQRYSTGSTAYLAVELEDPSIPCTVKMCDLFEVSIDGDSISFDATSISLDNGGSASRPSIAVLFGYSKAPGQSTVTVAVKDHPELSTTFDVIVKDDVPELTVSDVTVAVGDVARGISGGSWGEAIPTEWPFLPYYMYSYMEHKRWNDDDPLYEGPFVTSASSSDGAIIRIDEISSDGKDMCPYRFTAVGEGIAAITLKDIFDKEYTFNVTVTAASDEEERIDSITLDRDTLALKTSDVLEDNILAATIEGGSEGSVRSHVWSSSDVSVARVEPMEGDDSRCRVVPVGAGECIITVTAGGKAAVCKITVEAAKVASSPASSDLKAEVGLPFAPDAETMQELSELSLVVNKKTVEPNDSQSSALDALSQEGKGVQGVYEINFVNASDGTIHPWNKPNVPIDVRILMDDGLRAAASRGLTVYYLDDNGGRVVMTTWIDGDYLVFRTTHFSTYALVYDAGTDTTPVAPPESTPSTPADPLNPISGPVSPGNMGTAPTLPDDVSGGVSGVTLSQTGDDVPAGPLGAAAGLAAIACLACVIWRLKDMTDKTSV